MEGIFIGILAASAMIILFMRLPVKLRIIATQWPLIAELLSLLFFFLSITSITSSIAGVLGALLAGGLWTVFFILYKYNMTYENTNASHS